MANQTEVIQNLKELLQSDSKSSNIDGVNATGKRIKEMLKELPLDWTNRKVEGAADLLVARSKNFDNSKPVILLSAHMDVVMTATDVEVNESEDKLYGAGAQDVKGAIIALIEVLKRLNQDGKLENIILVLNSEEELATPHFRDQLKDLAIEADYIMVFEPTLNYEPYANLNKRSIVVSRRGFQAYELEIEGPGGHSGILYKKEERKSAILMLAEVVLELEKLADYDKKTTLNSGVINAGKAFNVIAPNAHLIFETRFQSNDELERIKREVKALIDGKSEENKDFKFKLSEGLFVPAVFECRANEEFIKISEEVAKNQNIELISEKRTGGSDAGFFCFYNPKAAVLDGFGIRGDGEHTKNEFVFKETIFSTIEYVHEVIKRIQSRA